MTSQKPSKELYPYLEKTKKSFNTMEEAKKVMPNGVTANIKSFSPYPLVMEKAQGAYIYDKDGNQYVDYLMAYGSLILGHGHPKVQEAILNQLETNGTNLFGTPHQLEIDMGKRIQQYYPCIDLLRYTNSGTEATLLALRLAASYTGKHKVAKFEGHYHGGYDQMLFSINPSANEFGPIDNPNSVTESKGIAPYHQQNILMLPFNDLERTATLLKRHKDEVGGVIIEPIQSGFIPATKDFLLGLREITKELEIVLIFDEVKTGFRIDLGGAQAFYNIKPDLTTLGKAIGGGYPIGIVGGKKEILMESAATFDSDVFDSSKSKVSSSKDVLFHSGTYNGHPTILAAGMAVLDVLEENNGVILKRTEYLKKELEKLFSHHNIPMKAIGKGSIFSVVLTNRDKIRNYREYLSTNTLQRKKLDYYLLNEGIYTKPLNRYSVSVAHNEPEIHLTLNAYEQAISMLKRDI